jgi:hypothetical protein
MADQLDSFATSPNRQLLAHRHDCTFQYLYCPHIPDNIESLQALPNDDNIFYFIQDEPINPKEIISIEDNKIPKGLTPL